MIAPALAPATFTQRRTGFVSCSAKPCSAPASAMPLTPPPRKTPSASSIHCMRALTVGGLPSLLLSHHRPPPSARYCAADPSVLSLVEDGRNDDLRTDPLRWERHFDECGDVSKDLPVAPGTFRLLLAGWRALSPKR